MPTYLINGPSGTGKTSVGNELKKRGYSVFDTDESFGYYANLETEEVVEFPGENVTEEWYSKYGWIWDRVKVEKVLSNKTDTIFFCGGSLNESIYYPKFTSIIRLVVTPEVLVQRIQSRKGDEHTNNPAFIERMVKFLETARADAEKLGWIVVDTSSKTAKASVDEILSRLEI